MQRIITIEKIKINNFLISVQFKYQLKNAPSVKMNNKKIKEMHKIIIVK